MDRSAAAAADAPRGFGLRRSGPGNSHCGEPHARADTSSVSESPPGSAGVPPAPGRRPAMDDPPKAHRYVQAGNARCPRSQESAHAERSFLGARASRPQVGRRPTGVFKRARCPRSRGVRRSRRLAWGDAIREMPAAVSATASTASASIRSVTSPSSPPFCTRARQLLPPHRRGPRNGYTLKKWRLRHEVVSPYGAPGAGRPCVAHLLRPRSSRARLRPRPPPPRCPRAGLHNATPGESARGDHGRRSPCPDSRGGVIAGPRSRRPGPRARGRRPSPRGPDRRTRRSRSPHRRRCDGTCCRAPR